MANRRKSIISWVIYFEAWKLFKWFLISIRITDVTVQNLFKKKKKKENTA